MNDTLTAEIELLKKYLEAIENKFQGLSSQNRWMLLEKVRKLSGEGDSYFPEFDFRKAREIRKRLGISRVDLGGQIGIHYMTIYRYETGGINPLSKGDSSAKYIKWLIDNGFDEKIQGT